MKALSHACYLISPTALSNFFYLPILVDLVTNLIQLEGVGNSSNVHIHLPMQAVIMNSTTDIPEQWIAILIAVSRRPMSSLYIASGVHLNLNSTICMQLQILWEEDKVEAVRLARRLQKPNVWDHLPPVFLDQCPSTKCCSTACN